MNLKSKMKLLFKSLFTQFGAVNSNEGIQILWNEEGDLMEGYEVFMEQENENGEIEYVPVPDGEYHYDDKVIVVVEGKVSEIREVEKVEDPVEPAAESMEEPAVGEQPVMTPEDVTITEPIFDPEKEINNLRMEMNGKIDALSKEVVSLKEMVAKLLEVPAEEDAFAASKKNEEVEQKGFMFKANKK